MEAILKRRHLRRKCNTNTFVIFDFPEFIFPGGQDFYQLAGIFRDLPMICKFEKFPEKICHATSRIFMDWSGLCLGRLLTFLAQWIRLVAVSRALVGFTFGEVANAFSLTDQTELSPVVQLHQ